MNLNTRCFVYFIALFAVCQVNAQSKSTTELDDFKIIIKNTSEGIEMKCLQGSAWIDLSFSMKKDAIQAVSQFGMEQLQNLTDQKDANLADYLFTIKKTNNKIELKGIEGTAWKKLAFTLGNGQEQAINASGMTSLN